MKTVILSREARDALAKHRDVAARILDKIEAYAAAPQAFAGSVRSLSGLPGKRPRVGDFRVVFEEDEAAVTVTRVAPRGSAYD